MKQLISLLQKARNFVSAPDLPSAPPVLGERCDVREGNPADVLVIDVSGSMDCPDYPPSRLVGATQAARRFLERRAASEPNAVAGIVRFGDAARIVAHLVPVRRHTSALNSVLSGLRCDGSTNMGAGVQLAHQELRKVSRSSSRRVVLLTDGHANEGPDPEAMAAAAKQDRIQLDIIGIGGSPADVDEPVLKRMASIVNKQRRYWFIRSVEELVDKFETLALREVK